MKIKYRWGYWWHFGSNGYAQAFNSIREMQECFRRREY